MSDPEGLRNGGRVVDPVQSSKSVGNVALRQRYMPQDLSIAIAPGRGADIATPDRGPRRHPMKGFEDTYVDIVDYIVRITHRIWEDQDVGYIYDTYAPGCVVHDDAGVKIGVERMVAETVQSIDSFSDVCHYADEVIWAGDEDQGFVTSHRAVNVGHHTGAWRWGPPTGRKINLWVIANCAIRENEIHEEWVLYNTAARLLQIGIDVGKAARDYGNDPLYPQLSEARVAEVDRLVGGRKPLPYPAPQPGSFDVDHFVRGLFHDVFTRRNLSAVDRAYARNLRWYGASNRSGIGRASARSMYRSLLATFPDLDVTVDEFYWMGNETEGFRVALRWSGRGTHRGHALYGQPTGRRVSVWGLSQLYVQGREIVEEWSLFNEFDVMAQILRDDSPTVF